MSPDIVYRTYFYFDGATGKWCYSVPKFDLVGIGFETPADAVRAGHEAVAAVLPNLLLATPKLAIPERSADG